LIQKKKSQKHLNQFKQNSLMAKPFRKLTEPFRRFWWREKAARISAPVENRPLRSWMKHRKSYLNRSEFSREREVEIKVGKKKIKLRGADRFKWEYKKRKYVQQKIRPKIIENYKILKEKFQDLPQTNHQIYSLAYLFVDYLKKGKAQLSGNPKGPNVKLTMQGNTLTLEYTFHMGLKKLKKETRRIELSQQDLDLGAELGELNKKSTDISVNTVDQTTLEAIQSMK